MQPRHVVRDQLHAIVGYSKYHNVRIDNQVEANTLVPTLSRRKLLDLLYHNTTLDGLAAPRHQPDRVGLQWTGNIVSTYPNDDDAFPVNAVKHVPPRLNGPSDFVT
ncbi:hypothetical protein PR003_g26068 [Phytophthora rubi]|uniref:Uncharacterized protein n=1 Tax=Phytophthora rubi TaxID=129364 RepID=A0A6A4CDJ6_9STRA|nr:hypothetical protein PR003_g26068 [Phytophthora rubi]